MCRTGWRDERDSTTYYGEHIRFTVHRSIYAPGKWFVSCYDLGTERRELVGITEMGDAKNAAVQLLNARLKDYANDITKAWQTHDAAEKKDEG